MATTYLSGNRIQKLSTETVETLTYSTDFSSDTGWSSNTADASISGGVLNWQANASSNEKGISYNLGSAASDTAWVLRFKLSITVTTRDPVGYDAFAAIGLASHDHTTGTSTTGQDGLSFAPYLDNLVRPYMFFRADDTKFDGNGVADRRILTTDTTTVGDVWYVEIVRNSATVATLKLYSTSSYTNPSETWTFSGANGINSSMTGLQYIVVKLLGGGTSVLGGTIDDLKFWNGVSSVNLYPINVPADSRLEETDTRKIYYSATVGLYGGSHGFDNTWTKVIFDPTTITGGATISDNSVTGGGANWSSQARSTVHYLSPIEGGGELYFTQNTTGNASVGLAKDNFNQYPNDIYQNKDFSFHTTTAANNIYERTTSYQGSAQNSATNQFRITMDSSGVVKYYFRSNGSAEWTLDRTSSVTATSSAKYYVSAGTASSSRSVTVFIKSPQSLVWSQVT